MSIIRSEQKLLTHELFSHKHLWTFKQNHYKIDLAYDSVKGLQAHLYLQNQRLSSDFIPPFPGMRFITNGQLDTFKTSLSTNYYVRVVRLEGDDFRVYLYPGLLGGGGCCSKQAGTKNKQLSTKKVSPDTAETSPFKPVIHFRKNPELSIQQASLPSSLTVSHIKNTHDLAYTLQHVNPSEEVYAEIEDLSFKVIEAFSAHVKRPELLNELTILCQGGNAQISHEVLSVIFNRIYAEPLLDADLLEALRDALLSADPTHLDPDDLVRILKTISNKCDTFHQQNTTLPKLHRLLHTLSGVLDAMADANVKGLSYDHLHDPLYKTLESLNKHEDLRICTQAAYAKQALLSVPHNETKLSLFVKRLVSGVKGIVNLANVISDKDPTLLLNAYQNFKNALHSQSKKQSWYDELRPALILIEKGSFVEFEKFVSEKTETNNNPYFAGSIVIALSAVIEHHSDLETRLSAVRFLTTMYIDDVTWNPLGQIPKDISDKAVKATSNLQDKLRGTALEILDKKRDLTSRNKALTYLAEKVADSADWSLASKVKVGILQQFYIIATSSDEQIRVLGRESLKTIRAISVTDRQKAWLLDAKIPQDLSTLPVSEQKAKKKEELCTELVAEAKAAPLSLPKLITRLRAQRLKDPIIKQELATYIAAPGSFESSCKQVFDLEEKVVSNFLTSTQKTLLLLGEAGTGKSTFAKYLENKLWKEWNPSKPIPLFIELATLKDPLSGAISEALKNHGFSSAQILQLKQSYSFLFFFDAFDETGLKEVNLYEGNKVGEWKEAKVIFSCRTSYLKGASYADWFTPYQNSLPQRNLFRELFVAPFSEGEIDAYLQKYVSVHQEDLKAQAPEWQTWEKYKNQIVQIHGLMGLISTPFILYITAEVLPDIVKSHNEEKSGEQLRLVGEDLYRAFVDNWFERNKGKLLVAGKLQGIDFDIKEGFLHYSKELAAKMHEKKITVVEYIPPVGSWVKDNSEWKEFFGKEPPAPLIARGLPVKKVGKNQYAFLHASLIDYFVARKAYDELMNVSSNIS